MRPFLVKRVIDGDTFEVIPEIPRHMVPQIPVQGLRKNIITQTETQRSERPSTFKHIRLANINASEGWTLQGKQATHYLKQLIEGKLVTFTPRGISYNRVVADVWRYPNKFFVNAAMVYRGHARWT